MSFDVLIAVFLFKSLGVLGSVVWECLLSFGAESVVFQFAIQKLKDQDI